jgi:hypothetical protein
VGEREGRIKMLEYKKLACYKVLHRVLFLRQVLMNVVVDLQLP